MPDFVQKPLEKYIAGIKVVNLKNQPLFVNKKTNEIYDHNAIYRRFKKMLKLNNLKEITLHDLRHTCATFFDHFRKFIIVFMTEHPCFFYKKHRKSHSMTTLLLFYLNSS